MNATFTPVSIPILVLAAGSAERFGSDKLLALVAGQPLLAWSLEAAIDAAPIDHALVLVAPAQDARRELCEAAGVATLVVDDAAHGMRWTLQAGLDACPADVPGAIVTLADDPLALRALPGVLATARRTPDRAVAVRRDPFLPHPVYLPRSAWPTPPRRDEDHGLRQLLLDLDVTWIEDAHAHPVDVDLPADVERLEHALAEASDF
jgi:molybdenum cofactor cytidylyltransferase